MGAACTSTASARRPAPSTGWTNCGGCASPHTQPQLDKLHGTRKSTHPAPRPAPSTNWANCVGHASPRSAWCMITISGWHVPPEQGASEQSMPVAPASRAAFEATMLMPAVSWVWKRIGIRLGSLSRARLMV